MIQAKDCPFCEIVAGRAEASTVYADDAAMAFMTLNPTRPGECLVVPRTHIDHFTDVPDELAAHIMIVAQHIGRRMREQLRPAANRHDRARVRRRARTSDPGATTRSGRHSLRSPRVHRERRDPVRGGPPAHSIAFRAGRHGRPATGPARTHVADDRGLSPQLPLSATTASTRPTDPTPRHHLGGRQRAG